MKKTLNTIHELLKQGNCPSKLMLAFKNSANLDEAKEEEVVAKTVKPCDTKCNKWGWYE
jgi:hypothetical protein